MFSKKLHRLFQSVLLAIAACCVHSSTYADVISQTKTIIALPGLQVIFPLTLSADTEVAAINGELLYDSSIYRDPQIEVTSAGSGFTALGNEVSPGRYRFVLFSTPPRQLKLHEPIVLFRIVPQESVVVITPSVVQYSLGAAATSDGFSLPGVNLQDVNIVPMRNSARAWSAYE